MDPKLARGLIRQLLRTSKKDLTPLTEACEILVARAHGFLKPGTMTAGNALSLVRAFDALVREQAAPVHTWNHPKAMKRSLRTELGYGTAHFVPLPTTGMFEHNNAACLSFRIVSCVATRRLFRIRWSHYPLILEHHAMDRYLERASRTVPQFWDDLLPTAMVAPLFSGAVRQAITPFVLPSRHGLFMGSTFPCEHPKDMDKGVFVEATPTDIEFGEDGVLVTHKGAILGHLVSTFIGDEDLRPDQTHLRDRLSALLAQHMGSVTDFQLSTSNYPRWDEREALWKLNDAQLALDRLISEITGLIAEPVWQAAVRPPPTIFGLKWDSPLAP